MSSEPAPWSVFEYEGFEIHVLPQDTGTRYGYIGHVCRHGANAELPGEAVHFHANSDDVFATADEAVDDARHVGRSIIDGTHLDLSILPLVSHHH